MSDGNHPGAGGRTWTFLTNHARVLICIARDPTGRIRDIADEIGITERAAQLIIADLERANYLSRTRVGRRNTYSINPQRPFRHPSEGDHRVQELISVFVGHDQTQRG
ncbi:MAG TPA: AsnC family transcriptional regulator [Streptosporangiaceae bacterium]|nr:AsnC family transcriptional regulator [Streptosporangiaceae bacterium]